MSGEERERDSKEGGRVSETERDESIRERETQSTDQCCYTETERRESKSQSHVPRCKKRR